MEKKVCEVCGKNEVWSGMCQECFNKFNLVEYQDEIDEATYSVEDNKLRLYCGRVSRELWLFLTTQKWQRAPKQGCFYGVWTPGKEDTAIKLVSEILDDDRSMLDRAMDKAERCEEYSEKAQARAESLEDEANEVLSRFSFGQPILVGHHSEKRARKDKERGNNKLRQASHNYKLVGWWKRKADAAIAHAEYKNSARAITNRIRKLQADRRKRERDMTIDRNTVEWWYDQWYCKHVENTYFDRRELTEDELAQWKEYVKRGIEARKRTATRWIEHLDQQIAYWTAVMKSEHGDIVEARNEKAAELEKGKWALRRTYKNYAYGQVQRVNKAKAGYISSVSIDPSTVSCNYYIARKWKPDEIIAIFDFKPTDEQIMAVLKPQPKQKPVETVTDYDKLKELEIKLKESEAAEVKVNHDPDYFPTPPAVIEKMASFITFNPGEAALEPSAGDGRIARYMREHGLDVQCIEVNYNACQVLKAAGFLVIGDDFLEVTPNRGYAVIMMNPPFSKGQDVKHIQHAYDFLYFGGTLVSVASEHSFFAQDKRSVAFRKWLEDVGAYVEELPDGSFAESGTMVKTRLVVIKK